jgi:hypothetical protein
MTARLIVRRVRDLSDAAQEFSRVVNDLILVKRGEGRLPVLDRTV